MCGIAGIFDVRDTRPIERPLLGRMNDAQFHRGPDEGGIHVEPGVGIAHRRLSIIDLSSGQQPLFNEDGSVAVVYNGEIYNFQNLRTELERMGHRFQTRSDTEVIVHAWEEWGEQCVTRFRGMFAFGLWDRKQRSLFLARDRLGIKPLYYAFLPDGYLIFGSELKALLAHPGMSRDLDGRAVEDYFAFGYVPEPKTVFEAARKLAPGHTMLVRRGVASPMPRQYWDVAFEANAELREADAGAQLIDRLREAVRIRLIAEVPLGAFLSGGVDSSAVVAMMAGISSEPVNTCSISFGDPKFNESAYAARVAQHCQTDHQVEQVDPDDFHLVDSLARLYDEPYADSSAIPTYRVCELARKRVTVALSGDGGDENLAGYRRYRWQVYGDRVRSLFPAGIRRPAFGFLGQLYPKADWAPKLLRAKSTLEELSRDSVAGYFHSVSLLGDGLRRRLFAERFRQELQGYRAVDVLYEHGRRAPTDDPLARVQYLDLKTYLVGDILTKVDRASMAHALEVRVPLLDHELVEWMATLPAALKLRGREGKYLLKKALEPYVPKDVLYRPKMGFSVPLASWFRGPLRERVRDAVLGSELGDSSIFNVAFLKEMLNQHQSGVRDYSTPLWSVLMFDAFLRNVMSESPATAGPARRVSM